MTQPSTPGEAITRAAQRLTAQRQAARTLAETLAQERQGQADADEVPAPQSAP